MVGDPGIDSEHSGVIIYLISIMNTLGSPQRSWQKLLGRRMPELPAAQISRRIWLQK